VIKKFLTQNWLLVLILILGAFLRFYRLGDYMEFLGDQGRDVLVIRNFFKHKDLFFIGPQTSIGNMYLGPYFYYLIAPSLLLANFNPVGPAAFIALLSLATIVLVYFVGQKWFSRPVGLIAAFLFAISPVVIKYSNFIWNPNVMPLFSLLFIYFFFEAIIQQKYKYFIYASLSFVMVINSHYLGLALLPFPGLYWLFYLYRHLKTKSKQLKPFLTNSLIAILVFILSLTPQVLFDLKHNGQNIKALINFFTYRETTVSIKPYKAIPELPAIFNQVNTDLLAAQNQTFGIIISLAFAVLIGFYLLSKNTKKTYFWVIFGWYLFGLSALALYKQHIYAHYFAFLFPAVFILIAILIHLFKYIGIPLFILITIISLINNPFKNQPQNQLVHAQNIATSINNHLDPSDGQYNVVLLASYNDFKALAPRYFLKSDNLLSPEKYQEADTLFIVIDDPNKWPDGINSDIWEIKVFESQNKVDEFITSDGVKVVKLQKIKNN